MNKEVIDRLNRYSKESMIPKSKILEKSLIEYMDKKEAYMILKDRCKNEDVNFALANFLDDFRANPSYDYIKDSILELDNLTDVEKATFAATVDALCCETHVKRPDWIFDSRTYLPKPHFAMNAKGGLRVILLRESPKWFRSRNLFVSANCLDRR